MEDQPTPTAAGDEAAVSALCSLIMSLNEIDHRKANWAQRMSCMSDAKVIASHIRDGKIPGVRFSETGITQADADYLVQRLKEAQESDADLRARLATVTAERDAAREACETWKKGMERTIAERDALAAKLAELDARCRHLDHTATLAKERADRAEGRVAELNAALLGTHRAAMDNAEITKAAQAEVARVSENWSEMCAGNAHATARMVKAEARVLVLDSGAIIQNGEVHPEVEQIIISARALVRGGYLTDEIESNNPVCLQLVDAINKLYPPNVELSGPASSPAPDQRPVGQCSCGFCMECTKDYKP